MKLEKKNFKIDDADNLIIKHKGDVPKPLEVYIPKCDLKRDFLVIRETLTRTGLVEGDRLLQLCHILFKRGNYYIVHYKDLLALDGKHPKLDGLDITYREHITGLLQKWEMIDVLDEAAQAYMLDQLESNQLSDPDKRISVIGYADKDSYILTPMYTIGSPKNRE